MIEAVKWIDELRETLVNDYGNFECGGEAVKALRADRLKVEETARVSIAIKRISIKYCDSNIHNFMDIPEILEDTHLEWQVFVDGVFKFYNLEMQLPHRKIKSDECSCSQSPIFAVILAQRSRQPPIKYSIFFEQAAD